MAHPPLIWGCSPKTWGSASLPLPHSLCACLVAQLCPALCDPMDSSPPGSFSPWDSPGKNTGGGCHFLPQRIFWTQGLSLHFLCILHCRWILYPLSRQGSPSHLPAKHISSTFGICLECNHFSHPSIGYHPHAGLTISYLNSCRGFLVSFGFNTEAKDILLNLRDIMSILCSQSPGVS